MIPRTFKLKNNDGGTDTIVKIMGRTIQIIDVGVTTISLDDNEVRNLITILELSQTRKSV